MVSKPADKSDSECCRAFESCRRRKHESWRNPPKARNIEFGKRQGQEKARDDCDAISLEFGPLEFAPFQGRKDNLLLIVWKASVD